MYIYIYIVLIYIYICIIVLWKHQTDVRMQADFSPNLKVLATVSNNPWMFFPPDRPQRNSRKWTAALIQHHLHRTARNSLGKIQMEVGSHELWIRLDFIVDWYWDFVTFFPVYRILPFPQCSTFVYTLGSTQNPNSIPSNYKEANSPPPNHRP